MTHSDAHQALLKHRGVYCSCCLFAQIKPETTLMSHIINIHYQEAGSGPDDVLLIHGWASSGVMWRRTMDELGDIAHFVAPDLPGFGNTPLDQARPPTVDAHVAALIAFCRARDLRPRAIVGHSMGGLIAMRLALARPRLAEQLVLINPVTNGSFGPYGLWGRLLQLPMAASLVRGAGEHVWKLAKGDLFVQLVTAPWQWHVERQVGEQLVMDFRRARWSSGMHGLLGMASARLEPHLHRIRQETLVMTGLKDVTVDPSEGRLAAAHIPNARLVEFPDAHHQLPDEDPDHYLDLLRRFLTRQL